VKKTRVLTLTLLAGAISGCSRMREAEVQRCVDENGTMADEQRCREQQWMPPYRPLYGWVYGGNGGYTPGSRVTGYNEVPLPNVEHVTASSLAARGYSVGGARVGITSSGGFAESSSRGGFGTTGEGRGGGGRS
jgi:hypothetical protein